MTLFVSYTKADDEVVRVIRADLERLGHSVWMDHQIHGGESWWREIIHEIQGASVFVFALSNSSWKSKPCRLELDYANDLGLPVLPLQVGPLDHMYIPLAERQIIDYQERTADSVVKLVTALTEMLSRRVVLPDPLPEPPPVPFEYLYRIASVMGPNRITPERQEELIGTLRRKLREEDDPLARVDIVKLLRELKDRNEITVPNAREVDEILAGATTDPDPEDGATRLPPADHWRKTGGEQTTSAAGRAEPPSAPTATAARTDAGSGPGSTRQPASGSAGMPGAKSGVDSGTAPGSTPGGAGSGSAGVGSGVAGGSVSGGVAGGAASGPAGVDSGAARGSVPGGAGAAAAPSGGDPSTTTPEAGADAKPAQAGAPAWLADFVRADTGVRRPVPPQHVPEAAAGTGWWTQPPSGHPQQTTEPGRKRLFGPLGIGLGIVGMVFVVLAVADGLDATLAIGALLVGVLGVSVGGVAVARREPGARTAVVIAAVGLVGAVVYAVASWS